MPDTSLFKKKKTHRISLPCIQPWKDATIQNTEKHKNVNKELSSAKQEAKQ